MTTGSAGGTVVWDLGGVVLEWSPRRLVAATLGHLVGELAPDAAALADLVFQDFAVGSDWTGYDRGDHDAAGVAAAISARTGIPRRDVEGMLAAIPEHLVVDREVLALVARTAAAHRAVFLSNMPADLAAHLAGLPEFAVFDDGVYSALVRAAKPEAGIFEVAERRFGLDPARTVLVDDREPNLAAARARGWSGVLFTGAADAAARLEGAGWC